MSAPTKSQLARRKNASAAIAAAKGDGTLLSPLILTVDARDARDWLVAHGWSKRAAVSLGLVLLAQREREREARDATPAD